MIFNNSFQKELLILQAQDRMAQRLLEKKRKEFIKKGDDIIRFEVDENIRKKIIDVNKTIH